MSTKLKDSLHELIQYMSKSEKRYFKVMSTRHVLGEENNYVRIFDFLDSLEEYDEDIIFNKFKGEALLNKFSITKKRLYDQIITSLDNFHSANLVDAQIYKLISSALILKQKSLYNQAQKQLRSAFKIAQKNDKFNLLAEINLHLKKIHESQNVFSNVEIEEMLNQDMEFHNKSNSYNQLWTLKTQLFEIINSKSSEQKAEKLAKIKVKIDLFLLDFPEKYWYFETIYLMNHIYSAYFFTIENYAESLSFLEKNISLFESQEFDQEVNISKYLSVLSNAIYIAHRLNKKANLTILREKLFQIFTSGEFSKYEEQQLKLFSIYYSTELTILTLEGRNEEALQLIPIVENGLLVYGDKLSENRKAFLLFKIASVYFAEENFHASLKCLNTILNSSDLENQEEIHAFAQLLSLLIHFELGNLDFLPYAIKSCQRYLKSKNRMFDFETNFLKLFLKFSKAENKLQIQDLAGDFHSNMSNSIDFNPDIFSQEYFDFLSWVKSKALSKSYKNVITENYQRKISA